jgi:adenine-specific DNA-methyltransferase
MPYINWMGKDDVKDHHKNIAYKTIECKEEFGDIDSQNMIIKGDNLLALKSLLPYYASSIKMIYIDPPYNTGNTSWVYNDNMDSPLIKKWLNDTVNADDLSRSDKWLCMMYPRLKLLRELLKDDGVIFISIDDAEVAHLRMICDEIFGSDNFISNIIWQKKFARQNDATYFSTMHDHILCYAKNKRVGKKDNGFEINLIERTEKETKDYKNLDNDKRGRWISVDLSAKSGNDKLKYKITTPKGIEYYPAEGRFWSVNNTKFEELIKDNRIWFGKDGKGRPRLKTFLSEVQNGMVPNSIWFHNEVSHTQDAKQFLKIIFNGKSNFETPKPYQLIQHIIKLSTSKNDIILDSFAGSGTTAHAVLEQNKQDGGNRKFILIETLDYAKTLTAERVKRVIKGYDFTGKDKTTLYEKKLTTTQILKPETMEKISKEVNKIVEDEKPNYTKIEKTFKENTIKIVGIKDIKSFKDGIGGGFKYCELSHDIFDEFGELNPKLTFDQIAKHIYFVEFKKPINKTTIKAPFIGSYKHKYIYFYENKFLKRDMKELIKQNDDYKQIIVYTTKTSISDDELKNNNIIIRYIPYDIKDN